MKDGHNVEEVEGWFADGPGRRRLRWVFHDDGTHSVPANRRDRHRRDHSFPLQTGAEEGCSPVWLGHFTMGAAHCSPQL